MGIGSNGHEFLLRLAMSFSTSYSERDLKLLNTFFFVERVSRRIIPRFTNWI